MTMPWKIMIGLAMGVVVLTLGMAAFVAYLMYPAAKSPSPPSFPAASNRAEANRQDLAYLKSALHQMDRSFSASKWAAFEKQVDELSHQADQLNPAAFEMGVAKAVSFSRNGHTNLLGAARGLTLNSYPLRFYWFADGLYVVKADAAHADLLGAKVLKVGGRDVGEFVSLAGHYVGGSPSLARELAPYFMESPAALHAIGIQESPSDGDVTLQSAGGGMLERHLTADPGPVTGAAPEKSVLTLKFDPRELYWPRRELSPLPLPAKAAYPQPSADNRAWSHVLDQHPVPFTLRNPNQFYWSTYLAGGQVLFVQINVTMDQPGAEHLKVFLKRVLAEANAKKPRYAIVDLRWNPGGSYQHTADFARHLPSVIPFDGKIFILTSGNTFSAGLVTTARLKYFAGARGEIVGEPVGDYPQFWAEAGARIVLPNSGLRIGYATGYHDWEHDCSLTQILTCYPGNFTLGVAAGSLQPTIAASWSFADYLTGRDTAVETIMQTIASAK